MPGTTATGYSAVGLAFGAVAAGADRGGGCPGFPMPGPTATGYRRERVAAGKGRGQMHL
jgi:hypothetical protein